MSRRWWTLAAIVLVLAAAVGGTLYLKRPKPAPADADGIRIELTTREEAALVKVLLADRAEGTLALEKKGDAWTAPAARASVLDAASTRNLVYYFWSLSADGVVEENPADLAPFGLAPARVRAEGTFSDGTVVTYLLGDRTPAGDGYYLQLKGDSRVYKVWTIMGDQLHWTLADLRDRTISPPVAPEEIVFVRVRRPDGRVVEIVEKSTAEAKDLQLGFGRYFLVRPYRLPRGLHSEKQEAFLKEVLAVSIDDFVDDAPGDPAAYGLGKPWAEVLVRDRAGNSRGLQFGAARSDGKRFFRVVGRPNVYGVEEAKLAFLATPVFDIAEKFAFIPNIDDVDSMEITAGGITHTFALSREKKPAAEEGAEEEVVTSFTLDGKPLDEDPARKLYQRVIGLLVEGEVRNPPPGAAEVRTRFVLNRGGAREVTVSYVPYDRDFYAVFVSGLCDFAISKGQLRAMLAALERVIAGETLAD